MQEGKVLNHEHKKWHRTATAFLYAARSVSLFLLGVALLWGSYRSFFFLSSPLNLILGIALFSVGLGFALIGPLDFAQIFTDHRFWRGVCPFCSPVRLKDIFLPQALKQPLKLHQKEKGPPAYS